MHRQAFDGAGKPGRFGNIGEKAIALFDPGTRRGVVVMTNGANGHKVMMPIAGRLMGDPRLAELLTAPYG